MSACIFNLSCVRDDFVNYGSIWADDFPGEDGGHTLMVVHSAPPKFDTCCPVICDCRVIYAISACFPDPQFIFSDTDALVTVDGSQFRVTVVESSDAEPGAGDRDENPTVGGGGDSSAGEAVRGFSGPSSDENVVADASKKVCV